MSDSFVKNIIALDCSVLDGRNHLGRFDYSAGGVARNICEALAKLGCQSDFISAVGGDQQGSILLGRIPAGSRKFVKKIAKGNTAQCIVVLDKKGDCSFLMGDMGIHKEITAEMIEQHEELIRNSPLLIMDGNISKEATETTLRLADKHKVPVFYEPTDLSIAKRPFTAKNWRAIKFITPNLTELKDIASCLNIDVTERFSTPLEEASNIAYKLAELIENVIVTLGPRGVLIARKGEATDGFLTSNSNAQRSVRHYPVKGISDFVNVSGAGDCFASGFITALLRNSPENRCVSVGLAAATIALYSQSPVPNEIFDFAHKSWRKEAEFIKLK